MEYSRNLAKTDSLIKLLLANFGWPGFVSANSCHRAARDAKLVPWLPTRLRGFAFGSGGHGGIVRSGEETIDTKGANPLRRVSPSKRIRKGREVIASEGANI